MKSILNRSLVILLLALLCSCKVYKQDIMFKLNREFPKTELSNAMMYAERNYVIQKNDYLSIDVFTNKGERIIDPNNELQQGMQNQRRTHEEFSYLVKQDGTVKLPIVGQIKIDSLTLDMAERLLETEYDKYYKESFVKLNYTNKRVILLGALGGQMIPLVNENMTLIEILAMAGGLDMGSKSQNIKLIRGDLSAPEVFQINLSTIDGMRNTMISMEPGDIIYVEPWRRPWLEGIRDISPVLSLLSSSLALILVLQNLNAN